MSSDLKRGPGFSLALVLLAAGPGLTQTSDVVTLTAPSPPPIVGTFGRVVSSAGDVNRDGFADVIVGTGGQDDGRAFVFSGQNASVLFALSSPHEQFDGRFGESVSGAGDVNGDGYPDLLVGAHAEFPGKSPRQAGRAYLFSGKNGRLLFELASPNEEAMGNFGRSLAGAGDVNQDGFADVIVGALLEDPGKSAEDVGRAYVFSGHDGHVLFALGSLEEVAAGYFGWSVSAAGDINQDGFADVAVGAIGGGPASGPRDSGRAFVFSGRDGSRLFELVSPHPEFLGSFGQSVSAAGDVNQDGFADVIVGARNEHPGSRPKGAGSAYVFSGSDGHVLFELRSPHPRRGGLFGESVSGAGDVNQDGFADVIVGAYYESSVRGRAYVFSGRNGELLRELKSPNDEAGGCFGVSVAGAGDVNRDGSADVIVGADREDAKTGQLDAGRAYIFLSGDPSNRNDPTPRPPQP